HSAGTDMTLIKRMMKQNEWKLPVGLDRGDDVLKGATAQDYALRNPLGVVMVDRQGTILFHSRTDLPDEQKAMGRKMDAVAKSAKIPWPPPKDASKDEMAEAFRQLQLAFYSQVIDKALQRGSADQ
ncbi:MAG: hypothetical protein MI861_20875, partial [Pirellulales bacterium]|nr:hypothetical protein [Pirellulales bacterium]